MAKTFLTGFNLHDWFEHEKDDFADDVYIYPKRRLLFSLLLILILLFGVFVIWSFLFERDLISFDLAVENTVKSLRTQTGTNFFRIITTLGSQYFVIGLGFLLAIPLFMKHRKKAAVIFISTLLTTIILVVVLKDIFGRSRPFGCIDGYDCYSFPSGHAALSFYFYGIISYLIMRFAKIRKKWLSSWIFGMMLLITLIAVSRIYLGFHFFTDIVAGFFVGGICWLIAAITIDLFYKKYL